MEARSGYAGEMRSWIEDELAGCKFADARLEKRFRTLITQMSRGIGESIPMACQDWGGTKAAYRFFSNDRLSEAEILAGHFQSTRTRFQKTPGTILVLHDTTELSFKREKKDTIGITGLSYCGRKKDNRAHLRAVCGMLLHSSLVVTLEGLPLGIAAVKCWTRKKFKGCNALKKRINPTRIAIEEKESMRWIENLRQSSALLNDPDRCIHIGDRESDIYELFCAAQDCGTHFLVRTCADRLADDGHHTVKYLMQKINVQGRHTIEVRDAKGNRSEAVLDIRYHRLRLLAPVGKRKKYPPIDITVIHAQERGNPKGRDRIDWKLATDLPVTSLATAVEMLEWYAMRWKIETFHKILKSGCKAEDSKLRTAERLVRLMAVFCILSWRIFWMTMVNRSATPAPASAVFTTMECSLMDQLVPDHPASSANSKSLSKYITKVARLGGYLARASDPPPGNIVMWRGVSRLTDLMLGFQMAKIVGN